MTLEGALQIWEMKEGEADLSSWLHPIDFDFTPQESVTWFVRFSPTRPQAGEHMLAIVATQHPDSPLGKAFTEVTQITAAWLEVQSNWEAMRYMIGMALWDLAERLTYKLLEERGYDMDLVDEITDNWDVGYARTEDGRTFGDMFAELERTRRQP